MEPRTPEVEQVWLLAHDLAAGVLQGGLGRREAQLEQIDKLAYDSAMDAGLSEGEAQQCAQVLATCVRALVAILGQGGAGPAGRA